MADLGTIISKVTTITTSWFQNVNDAVYRAIGTGVGGTAPSTPADVRTNLGLTANSGSSLVGYIQSGTGAASRTIQDKIREIISVKDYGCVGDGITDDTINFQAAINAWRTAIAAVGDNAGTVFLDLCGGTYLVTSSLDFTKIVSWGWSFGNGLIIGKCTGKAVVDTSGSRGGTIQNFSVYGDPTNKPRIGIQSARGSSAAYAFCDHVKFINVSVTGYFSVAAVYFYGQEACLHSGCQYWNSDYQGYAAIHSGYDWVAYQSDYLTCITGDTSYTVNKYLSCTYRYLPKSSDFANITGISKANPAVVTVVSHPFVNGDSVVIGQILTGMTEINNLSAIIANATPTSFELTGIDSTTFTPWTSGGTVVRKQTNAPILYSRGDDQQFDNCYCVGYGDDSIQWKFTPTERAVFRNRLDFSYEGILSRSHIRIVTGGGSTVALRDINIGSHQTNCLTSYLSTDAAGAVYVVLDRGSIVIDENLRTAPVLLDNPSQYRLYGIDLMLPLRSQYSPSSSNPYNGKFHAIDDGLDKIWNTYLPSQNDNNSLSLTASPTAGAFINVTATAVVKRIDFLVFITVIIVMTDVGTGTGSIVLSGLPAALTASESSVLNGRVTGTGKMIQGRTSGTTITDIANYDNTSAIAAGQTIYLSGVYHTTAAF